MSSLHVSWTRFSEVERRILPCPTCERRRAMCCAFQEWYGWTVTCLTCGDKWQDGEMLPRPFKPRWRNENVEAARKLLLRVTARPGI